MCGSFRDKRVIASQPVAQQISPIWQAQFPRRIETFHQPSLAPVFSLRDEEATSSFVESEDNFNGKTRVAAS
jgi:hypothetical protein